MTWIYDVLPGGPADLTVVVDENGVLRAAGFRPVADLVAADVEPGEAPGIRAAWRDYLAGNLDALDRVAVLQPATAFQEDVWAELRRIPAGSPVTYGELAEAIGRPGAARAVGSACGANHVAPFVPCHRVVAASGGLGGYGYGLQVKEWLLEHERAGRAAAAVG